MKRITRRTFLKGCLGTAGLLLGGATYVRQVEPFWLDVQEPHIPTDHFQANSRGLKIGLLSDIHCCAVFTPKHIQDCVRLTNSLSPDLVVLTGDFVKDASEDRSYIRACAQALAPLRAPLGVYAVLGNHDYWTDAQEVTNQLQQAGIQVLVNERRRLTFQATEFWLLGADDAWEGHPDLDKLLQGIPPGDFKILLIHEPDFVDEVAPRGIQLQLSGHSHGGQFYLPIIGSPFLPYLATKYPMGLYHVGDTWLYTTRGVGVLPYSPYRLFCRPEITVLTLAPPPA